MGVMVASLLAPTRIHTNLHCLQLAGTIAVAKCHMCRVARNFCSRVSVHALLCALVCACLFVVFRCVVTFDLACFCANSCRLHISQNSSCGQLADQSGIKDKKESEPEPLCMCHL